MSDSFKEFAAGTAGGFTGKLLDFPLDTVKVLLQTQETTSASKSAEAATTTRYRGAWHCLVHTIETKGILSLYKGLSSPLLGSMAENALLFWAYSHCQRFLQSLNDNDAQELTLFQRSLAGAGAGAVVPFVLTPVELVKCRLQVQNHNASNGSNFRVYKGPMDVIVQTIRTEGIARGLYRGHVSTLLREIPGNFVWYGLYEGVCLAMTPAGGTKADLGPSVHLLGGALAGVGYWTAFYPADTVKSLIQTNADHMGKGFVETFVKVYQTQGIRGLYRGWGITAARAAPAHAAIFAVYEYTMKLLKSPSSDRSTDGSPPDRDKYGMHESIRD